MTTRRQVLTAAPVSCVLAALVQGVPLAAAQQQSQAKSDDALPQDFPYQDRKLVREMVGVCHVNEERVRALVELHPGLVHATIDWGFGDWETALGAAAHTGRRNIAEFLLDRGARIDIFAAAMLGQLDTLKALIAARPGAQKTIGPHGIPLLAHARAGGEKAAACVKFLESLDGAGDGLPVKPLPEPLRQACLGQYRLPDGQTFEVKADKEKTQFVMDDGRRWLHHVGDAEFYPAGVHSVRFKFAIADDSARSVSISEAKFSVTATRIA